MRPLSRKVRAGFERLLAPYEPYLSDWSGNVAYGLQPDLTLAYLNSGWFRFAAENAGEPSISNDWSLGRNIVEAIPNAIRRFFVSHYERCLRESRPWEHTYECSSEAVYRRFHMTVYPLGQSDGLLSISSLLVELPQHREASPPIDTQYRGSEGLIVQCCHCRRVLNVTVENRWDWVPGWVAESPEDISHGLCDACAAYYYPADREVDSFPETIHTTSSVEPASFRQPSPSGGGEERAGR